MTACRSSWNTGSVSLPEEAVGGAQGLLFLVYLWRIWRLPLGRTLQISKHSGRLSSTGFLQSTRQGARTIPLLLWWYLSSESNSPHCRYNQVWSPESWLLIHSKSTHLLPADFCALVLWLARGGARSAGPPQPLTEVAFQPTLSPRLLTLGGQTFHMPVSCQHRSGSSSNLGIKPPEQLTQGTWNACKEPMQRSHRKARRLAQQISSHQDVSPQSFLLGWDSVFGDRQWANRDPLFPKCVTYLLALLRRGSTSKLYNLGPESTPQLSNENKVLREENQRLQPQPSHIFRGRRAFPDPWPHQSPIREAKSEGGENRAT